MKILLKLRRNHILKHLREEIKGRIFRREMNNIEESGVLTIRIGANANKRYLVTG